MNSLIPCKPQPDVVETPRRGVITRILNQVLHANRRNELAVQKAWNELANPAIRFLICLIIDTSSSMRGRAIEMLFRGLMNFKTYLCENPVVARSTEIAVIRVGNPLEIVTDFVSAEEYEPSKLVAWGITPLAEGILTAIPLVEERLRCLESHNMEVHKAVLLTITDAEATDRDLIPSAIRELRRVESENTMEFLGVGINAEATRALKPFCGIHQPLELKDLEFDALFRNVSQHIVKVSVTGVGQNFHDGIIDAEWHK
jgi:uncharacterized protein YegL